MLVSVVIPAYSAKRTLADAVRSVLAQTWTDWECIVTSDDGIDYRAVLEQSGIKDSRLRFASTGRVGSGCHVARNCGMSQCQGDVVCALDADDVWMPRRLEVLAPQAILRGAAGDGPRVVSVSDGTVLYSVFDEVCVPFMLSVSQLLDLTCPIFPVTRRDLAFKRTPGIEHAEDVVNNLLLISSNGPIWTTPEPLMDYRVVAGSMCHARDSAARFDQAYFGITERVRQGGLGITAELRESAIAGLERKRELNRRFAQAQLKKPELGFQTFAARIRANLRQLG